MKRILLTVTAVGFALSAQATNIEVSYVYPASFKNGGHSGLARHVVGFYRQLEDANRVYANNDVNINLVPAQVKGITFNYSGEWNVSADYTEASPNYDVIPIVSNYANEQYNPVDVVVGYFGSGRTLGNAMSADQKNYDKVFTTEQYAFVLNDSVYLSSPYNKQYRSVFAHEMMHILGAKHNAEQAKLSGEWHDDNTVGLASYPTQCDNGKMSLMTAIGQDETIDEVQMSGSPSCIGDGVANMVTFANQYAEKFIALQDHTANATNTLTLAVEENPTQETFTFVATRTLNLNNAETGVLYVAGGASDSEVNQEIAPINLNFLENEANSQPVTLTFAEIHALFDVANDSYFSTYAVAVTSKEVQNKALNLLDKNTQWQAPVIEIPDPDGDKGESTPSQGGGGGSMNIIWLSLLGCIMWGRKRQVKN